MYHEHPLRILRYSAKNIWLLIFPLLRGIRAIKLDADRLYAWLKGSWFDIAVIGIIIVFGYVRWYYSMIEITDTGIIRHDGVFVRLKTTMPYCNISSVTFERRFYLVPLGAFRVSCDTSSGLFRAADMKLMMNQKFCDELMKHIPDVKKKDTANDIPSAGRISILLFSAFFSSGFSGMIYIAAFFFKGGDIAHDIINMSLNTLTEETEKLADSFIIHIPSAAIVVGVFFIGAWVLSFFVNFFRYSGFEADADEKCLKVMCGIFNRKEFRIRTAHINYTDLRQNMIMKITGSVAVNISCAGYGAEKNHMPLLMPVTFEKNIGKNFEKVGVSGGVKTEYCPPIRGLWQYIWEPTLIFLFMLPVSGYISAIFPRLSELIFFFTIMIEIAAVWFIIVKIMAFLTSGITIFDDKIMVRCCKWTGFHTVIAERSKIVKIRLQQSLPQKINKRCTVTLCFGGEEHSRFKVKALRVCDVNAIADVLGYDMKNKI